MLPKVSIIGRPNVGKSTLFNRLASGGQRALTVDRPGMTRDRKYATVSWEGIHFEIIDTGGFVVGSKESMLEKIKDQVDRAMDESELFLFLTDVKDGYTVLDQEIYHYIRAVAKPIIMVVNKVDSEKWLPHINDFFKNGCQIILPVSAEHKRGIEELLEQLTGMLSTRVSAMEETPVAAKICVIGRPNVGKSSLINRLIADERLIVSEMPGTTRDAVDIALNYNKQRYVIVDTAGLRKKWKGKEITEDLSARMAVQSIKRADIAFLVIDAFSGITSQDAAIGGLSRKFGKGLIILVNKWDLVTKDSGTINEFEKERMEKMKFLSFAPCLYVSAKTGLRVSRIMAEVEKITGTLTKRVPTPELNHFLRDMGGRGAESAMKVQYIVQAGVKPPHFILFSSSRAKIPMHYLRFISHRIHEKFEFYGTPLVVSVKTKRGRQTTA